MSPAQSAPGAVLAPPTSVAPQRATAPNVAAAPRIGAAPNVATVSIDLRGAAPVVELFFAPNRVTDGGLLVSMDKFEGQVFERRSTWRSAAFRAVELLVVIAVLFVGALLLLSPSDTKGSRDRGVERGVLTGYVGVPASSSPSPSPSSGRPQP